MDHMFCARCSVGPLGVAMMCDETIAAFWCEECFAKTPCGRGEHGEGCATKVFEGKEQG